MKASKALQEVWEMKRLAYEETKHLRGQAYFAAIHQKVQELLPPGMVLRTVRTASRSLVPATKVAETPAKYHAKRKR